MADIILPDNQYHHSNDVIFTLESLKEFIRLINMNGGGESVAIYTINADKNTYAVSNLNNYSQYLGDYQNANIPNGFTEFPKAEIDNALIKNATYIVVVNKSKTHFTTYNTNSPTSNNNIASGRHTYIRTTSQLSITQGIKRGTLVYSVNGGTPTTVYIGGFDTSTGSYSSHFFPTSNDTYYLGLAAAKWKGVYATNFYGNLQGNANSATSASQAIHAASANYATSAAQATHAASANYTATAGRAVYAASAGYAAKAGSVDKLGTGTVGGVINPIYLKAGVPTVCNVLSSADTTNGWFNGVLRSNSVGTTYLGKMLVFHLSDHTTTDYLTLTMTSATRLTCSKEFSATKVFNAVFNDYAECRTTIDLEPGRVVIDQDDGSLACASKRLQPGAQVISDTYGNLMGETETAKTPIAVAGRVLVYPYQPRENYHAGMAVCSAPGGTVDIMTREEIKEYPDCIVGIVSEIPTYETWGTDKVKVNNRIWIKVK